MKIVKVLIAVVLVAAIGVGAFLYFTAPEVQIVGEWDGEYTDYEFTKDGKVKVTYLDTVIPGINTPVTGTYEGDYVIEKDGKDVTLTIKTTINIIVDIHNEENFELGFEDGEMVLTRVFSDGSKGESYSFEKQK
ncbi:MAG: hypothetical protein IKJ27_11695 [Clostridia bacterium]|nr:hypothetical protein [Clostridia bacterium]